MPIPFIFGQSGIGALLNSADLNISSLAYSTTPARGSITTTFTRASVRTVMGYGPTANSGDAQVLLSCASGEAGFSGARRISEGVWSRYFTDGTPIPDSELLGMISEQAATQIMGTTADIRDMTTANWTLGATMTRARTSVGLDGVANSATRLTGGAVAATNIITHTVTAAASVRVYSAYVKRITGTGPVRITQDNFATSTDISGSLVANQWVLVQLSQSQLNAILGFKVDTDGDAIDVDCNQFETNTAGQGATSRILTGGQSRAKDVLIYTGTLIGTIKTLLVVFRRETIVANLGVAAVLDDGTTANTAAAYLADATASTFAGVTGGVSKWTQATSNVYTPGTHTKMAWSMATNDIKMAKDGVAQTQDTVATIPTITQLDIGHQVSSFHLNGHVKAVYGWTRNLSQSELNAVTV